MQADIITAWYGSRKKMIEGKNEGMGHLRALFASPYRAKVNLPQWGTYKNNNKKLELYGRTRTKKKQLPTAW
jgi:hypothetical protein